MNILFSDELLELVFSDEDMRTVPIGFQATVIHSIERIIEDNGYEVVKKEEDNL